jgi:transglutaminase/protease-like cytokinesis protein 3
MGHPGAPTGISDCITKINRIKDSVTQILARIITPGMTNDQKFTAIYNYVVQTPYDFSYNTPSMAFDSQTPIGVFVNKLAVCSGYSWAVNVLANTAGIQCYNVSGYGNNVAHAWTNANYNGGYSYFDCTWDYSFRPPNTYRYFAKPEFFFLQNGHVWNNTMINALVAEK